MQLRNFYCVQEFDENAFVREVTRRIGSSLDVGEALSATYDYLAQHFPLDAVNLTYREPDGNIHSVSEAGEKAKPEKQDASLLFIEPENMQNLIDGFQLRDQVVGDVLIYNQPGPPELAALIRQAYPDIEIPSSMVLFLKIGGEEVGLFSLIKYGDAIYTRDDAKRLQPAMEPIAMAMCNIRRHRELLLLKEKLAEDNRSLRQELYNSTEARIIGADGGLLDVMQRVQLAAPRSCPVLITGETGTGKELIANAIHRSSPRNAGPMVRVHCGAISDTLLDSELFGHEKGAFTGAVSTRHGRFERAEGGTIFLDEVGELSPEAQVRLLRVLQEYEIERVGGGKTIRVDVRVIAATNRDLRRMVEEGLFREDLWYRLAVFPIALPPLRERPQDIPELVTHFISRGFERIGSRRNPTISDGERARLQGYSWPGNVRELQNVIERALIVHTGGPLIISDLLLTDASSRPLDDTLPNSPLTLDDAMAAHIRQVLTAASGRIEGKGGAADLLAINPSTLRGRMRKLGITTVRQVSDD